MNKYQKVLAILPQIAVWFFVCVAIGAESRLDSPIEEKRYALASVNCHEWPDEPDYGKLSELVDKYNSEYAIPGKVITDKESGLALELARANMCVAYYTDEQKYYYASCQLQYNLAGIVSPEDWTNAGACGGTKKQTGKEKELIQKLMEAGWTKFALAKSTLESPRKNYYIFQYGRMYYNSKLNKEKGMQLMYEAAQSEYLEKGIEGFDKELIDITTSLTNASVEFKNKEIYRFVSVLDIALYDAGRLRMDGIEYLRNYEEIIKRWEAEGISENGLANPATDVVDFKTPPTAPTLVSPVTGETVGYGNVLAWSVADSTDVTNAHLHLSSKSDDIKIEQAETESDFTKFLIAASALLIILIAAFIIKKRRG